MSTPSGQPGQMGGFTNGGYGGLKQPQSANPNGYGGPDMRYGDVNPGVNMGYAAQNLPGTPFSYQEQAAGLYGTPFQSDPNQYGRWNWANQGWGPGTPSTPGAPGSPPIPPGTPPPGNPGSPPIPPGPGAPPPQTGGGNPAAVDSRSLFGGMSRDQQMAQPYNPGVPTQGDIWSNPAFANQMAGYNGGTLGGPTQKFVVHPKGRGGVRGLLG